MDQLTSLMVINNKSLREHFLDLSIDNARVESGIEIKLIDSDLPGSILHARDLVFSQCSKAHAVLLTRKWHSRLPNTQKAPWKYAFKASYGGITYAVALWNNPSARMLPQNWIELRRFSCAPDAPKNTASRFLSWMVRYFKHSHTEYTKCISYQDTVVHTGAIYKASGWKIGFVTKKRLRNRQIIRRGTNRYYRIGINGEEIDTCEKYRWEIDL